MGLVILAHQGGWDEALLVLAPIALLFLALWFANRRAARAESEQPGDDEQVSGD